MTAKNVSTTVIKQTSNFSGIAVLHNQQGNLMLPILGIFMVIGILLQSAELTRIAESTSMTANTRIRDSRNSLAFQLARYGALPTSFRNSVVASDNVDLQNCLFGNGSSACYADGREYPVKLYAAPVNGAPAKVVSGPGAGTLSQAQPVLYNNKGQLCETSGTTATIACPFEVTTTFKASCAGAATSCPTAESIVLHYSITTPEGLYSGASVKNRFVLASVENMSMDVKVADILPPDYNYVPNAITTVSYVMDTVVTPGTTTTVAGTVSYDDVLAAVVAAIGGSNQALVTKIATSLFNYYHITDSKTVGALALVWGQSEGVAQRLADAISYRMLNWQNYTPPTTAQIAEMAKVPLAIAPTNIQLAKAIASGTNADSAMNQQIANALLGVTDYQTQQYAVGARITNAAQATALQTAILASGLYNTPAYAFAEALAATNITNAAQITTYANVAVASGANATVARWIVEQGINSVSVATQLMASQPAPTVTQTASTTTSTPTTTTSSTTTTTKTTTTQTMTASIVPVTYTAACANIATCGTTIGM